MAELATIARPYAKALYELAQKKNKLKVWLDELAILAEVDENPKIRELIGSPRYDKNEKLKIIFQIIGENNLDPLLKNFVVVLAEHKRIKLLGPIYDIYQKMALAEEHIEQATVYSAYPLTDNELAELVKAVENHCKVKLEAKLVIESELIGGFKVEFGDQVLDMSVKSELNLLYRTMIS